VVAVVLGAIAGARGGASLVDGGPFAYALGFAGAIVAAFLVGLVELVIYMLL
jgi:hypothetical protein